MAKKKLFEGRSFTFLLSLWRYLATCFASSVLPAVKKRQSMNACSFWYRIEWLRWLCSDRHFPIDSQLSSVLSVLFKKKNLKHWLRVEPKFKINGAKTFRSLESGIRKDGRKRKRPTCLNGSDQIMAECACGRKNQSELTVFSANLQIYWTLVQVIWWRNLEDWEGKF